MEQKFVKLTYEILLNEDAAGFIRRNCPALGCKGGARGLKGIFSAKWGTRVKKPRACPGDLFFLPTFRFERLKTSLSA